MVQVDLKIVDSEKWCFHTSTSSKNEKKKVTNHVGGSENDMYSPTYSRFNEKINGGYWNTSMVVIECYKHLNFNPPEKNV